MSENSGYLILTKSGVLGRTYHKDKLVNGKQVVYATDENSNDIKLLCDPDSLIIKGFID